MKGVVFTVFVDMIENQYGFDLVDDLIEEAQLPSKGSYTTVGTYDYQELVTLVTLLSQKTQVPAPELVRTFGHHLAGAFTQKFSGFFEACDNTLDFLQQVDDHIHVEVNKLYPDAELPTFRYQRIDDTTLDLFYESSRHLADLAFGLIEATGQHYGNRLSIDRQDSEKDGRQHSHFHIKWLQ